MDASRAAGHFQIARLRHREGRIDLALEAAKRGTEADPRHAPSWILYARLLATQGRAAEAVTALENLAGQNPDDLGLKVALGEAQLAAGRPLDAMDTARAALKKAETSVPAMKVLARAYITAGNDATAEAILERALEITPDAEAMLMRGHIETRRKAVNAARLWYDKALEQDFYFVEALVNAGATYLAMKNFGAAADVLDRATRVAPSFAPAWLNLGNAFRGLKRFVEAEQAWKKALSLDPKLVDAWYNLGILYLENELPGLELEVRLNASIDAFSTYRQGNPPTSGEAEELDKFVGEAKLLIEQMKKAKEEALKKPKDEKGKKKKKDEDEGWDDEGGSDDAGGDDEGWDEDEGGGSEEKPEKDGDDEGWDDEGGSDESAAKPPAEKPAEEKPGEVKPDEGGDEGGGDDDGWDEE
jgi:tetratricopeptide (TPR) repeat protein